MSCAGTFSYLDAFWSLSVCPLPTIKIHRYHFLIFVLSPPCRFVLNKTWCIFLCGPVLQLSTTFLVLFSFLRNILSLKFGVSSDPLILTVSFSLLYFPNGSFFQWILWIVNEIYTYGGSAPCYADSWRQLLSKVTQSWDLTLVMSQLPWWILSQGCMTVPPKCNYSWFQLHTMCTAVSNCTELQNSEKRSWCEKNLLKNFLWPIYFFGKCHSNWQVYLEIRFECCSRKSGLG